MKTIQTPAYAVALLLGTALFARAQRTEFPYSHWVSVQTGLLQDLVLGGQNIVVSYTTRRMVFD